MNFLIGCVNAHWVSVSMFILITPYDTASVISSGVEPEPPWNTKSSGFGPVLRSFSTNFCDSSKIGGFNLTLPGAYTPCVLPNDAATVNAPTGLSTSYARSTSDGLVYSLEWSTPELSTPSSSPPVTPSSISSVILSLAMRVRYLRQISRLWSSGSSDKSNMCELNSGSPFLAKYSSPAVNTPSTQGRSFLAQWSVWRTTGTPYTAAKVRTWSAPAMEPAIDACCAELSKNLPA